MILQLPPTGSFIQCSWNKLKIKLKGFFNATVMFYFIGQFLWINIFQFLLPHQSTTILINLEPSEYQMLCFQMFNQTHIYAHFWVFLGVQFFSCTVFWVRFQGFMGAVFKKRPFLGIFKGTVFWFGFRDGGFWGR